MIAIHSLGNALELQVTGELDRHDVIAAREAVDRAVDDMGQVSLLIWLADFEGHATPSVLFDDLRLAFDHRREIVKLAVVGDARWLKPLLRVGSKLAPYTEVRRFEPSDRDRARQWVTSPRRIDSAVASDRLR